MKKLTMSREEWEAFRDWQLKELSDSWAAFRTNFMTDEEIEEEIDGEVLDEYERETGALDDETEKRLLDEMEAWQEARAAELVALAEKLGCSIYLAAYLKQLDSKLELIGNVFGDGKVMMREPHKKQAA